MKLLLKLLCVGCERLPGLIQCSSCHRQQGAGPLLCMTAWNEAAEPRWEISTTLSTAPLQLHTPNNTNPFPIHISPADPMQHKVWCNSSTGAHSQKGGSENCRCQQLTPTRMVLSSLGTHSSSVTAGSHCSLSMYSKVGGGDLIVSLPSHCHQESISLCPEWLYKVLVSLVVVVIA